MAFFKFRGAKNKVYVYYHSNDLGHLVQVKRKDTKHLDGKPPEVIRHWVETWEKQHGRVIQRSQRIHLNHDDPLQDLWDKYQAHWKATRKRRDSTAEKETSEVFDTHIVPFFVGKHQKKDPATWHDLVPDFHAHLFKQKFSDATISKTLWTLERFGKYLTFSRYMSFPFTVQVPARENRKETPLKNELTAEQVIKWARKPKFKYERIDFRLMGLLGYFAALRPSELFALNREDLITGTQAETHTKTLEGFRARGLGTKLSVNVYKTLQSGGDPQEMTKSDYSKAVVNIWHAEAARIIADIVKQRPTGRLFPYSYDWLMEAWRRYSKLGITLHDLRRASGLYLGRTLRIDLTLFQEHMRHAEIETSMLYTRAPSKPEKVIALRQDFDDI